MRKVAVNGIISTIAGNGTANYNDDGGSATATQFESILLVWLLSAIVVMCLLLILFIIRVRKLDHSGGWLHLLLFLRLRVLVLFVLRLLLVVADDGPAIDAQLNTPTDVVENVWWRVSLLVDRN